MTHTLTRRTKDGWRLEKEEDQQEDDTGALVMGANEKAMDSPNVMLWMGENPGRTMLEELRVGMWKSGGLGLRTSKDERLLQTALDGANMKAEGISRVEVLMVLREESEKSLGHTTRKTSRNTFERIVNKLTARRVIEALEKVRKLKEVKFGVIIIGRDG